MLEINKIYLGDCLELMRDIPDKSVDCIICDLPYNTTLNNWDNLIPFDLLWNEYRRITKDNSPIVLFAQQPFTSKLVMSNLKEYRHQWVWNKNNSAGFATAKIRPFAICEDVLVFGKNKVNYYPIMTKGVYRNKGGYSASNNYGLQPTKTNEKNDEYYPKNLLNYSNANQNDKIHPTQKPLALIEYLIKTYSNEGDLILDNCSGSGTTAIACHNTRRNFICIEKDYDYWKASVERLEREQAQLKLF